MTRTIRTATLFAGLLALPLAGYADHKPGHTKGGGGGEFAPASLEVSDEIALYRLRGDGARPGAAPNSSLYDESDTCVGSGVKGSGLFFFRIPNGLNCAGDPTRFFTFDQTGLETVFDFDRDGPPKTGDPETVDSVYFLQIDANNFFSSDTASIRIKVLGTLYDLEGKPTHDGTIAWILHYASVPVVELSPTERRGTAFGASADATICEVVDDGRGRPRCEDRGTINLPFEWTVTIQP